MARHKMLPKSMTAEKLGELIDVKKVDTKLHVTKVEYTEAEIADFEHQSSLASRALDKLDKVLEHAKNVIKKGTAYDATLEVYRPENITVPPTKGSDALKANREYADAQIERGYREEITKLYILPDAEELKMIAVDIEGNEWEQYTRDMTRDEVKQYGKPILTGDSAKGLDIKPDGHDEKGRKKFKVEKKDDDQEDNDPFSLKNLEI